MIPQVDFRRIAVLTAAKRRNPLLPSRALPHHLLPEIRPSRYRTEVHLALDFETQKEIAKSVMQFGDMDYRERVAEDMIERWGSVMRLDLLGVAG